MIVFNHYLSFETEPLLQDDSDGGKYSIIPVVESADFSLSDTFPMVSPAVSMSGRDAQYYSKRAFDEMEGSFSWALDIKEVLVLIWDHKRRRILYIKHEKYSPEGLRFWVLHTFFPLVLELEGIYRILHVGSVEIEGKPVLFSAFSFGGKSTITDFFIRRGHTLLSDDSMGIDKRRDGYYAVPSYPFHRPYRELETLGFSASRFATEPKPLHALFVLQKEKANTPVRIRELKGIEKFKAVHYSSFIDFPFTKRDRFDYFAEMAGHVPVYRVHIPWDLERLEEVYDAIVTKVGRSME